MDKKLKQLVDSTFTGYTLDDVGHITELSVADRADEVLQKLQPLDKLVRFDTSVMSCDLTDAGLAHLENSRALRVVHLMKTDPARISADGFRHFVGLRKLESMHISLYEGDLDAAAMHIAKIPSLRECSMRGPLSDRGLEWLAGCQTLESLDILDSRISDAGMRFISQLKNLKWLSLEDASISDIGIPELSKLHRLEELFLGGTGVSDEGIAALTGLLRLRTLALSRTKISDGALKSIEKLRELEWLPLEDTSISDVGIVTLHNLQNLKYIDLGGTIVTAKGVKDLRKSLSKVDIRH